MSTGDQVFSQGDVMRRQRDFERQLRELTSGRRLEHAAVGRGGLRLHQGGSLTVDGGGDITVNNGGEITATSDLGAEVRIARGDIEFRRGSVTGEVSGRLFAAGSSNRLWLELIPPSSSGDPRDNVLIIEGRNGEEPGGNVFFFTAGNHEIVSTEESIFLEAALQILIKTTGTQSIFLDSGSGNVVIPNIGTSGNAVNLVHVAGSNRLAISTSSRRYKTDIKDIDIDPDAVLKLRPRTWLPAPKTVQENEDGTTRAVGFIAEELDEIGLGDFVTYDEQGRPDAIAYDRLTAALVPLVQRQQQQIDDLTARIEALESA